MPNAGVRDLSRSPRRGERSQLQRPSGTLPFWCVVVGEVTLEPPPPPRARCLEGLTDGRGDPPFTELLPAEPFPAGNRRLARRLVRAFTKVSQRRVPEIWQIGQAGGTPILMGGGGA